MPELTAEQQAFEVAMIENQDNWAMWPILPVKNVVRGIRDAKYLGVVTASSPSTVYLVTMFEVGIPGWRERCEVEDYESVERMVAAGWVGD